MPTTSQIRYAEPVIANVRRLCLRKGPAGVKDLSKSFRSEADAVPLEMFQNILSDNGIILKPTEYNLLTEAYGEDASNNQKFILVPAFLAAIGGLGGGRKDAVVEAFGRLDLAGRGYLDIESMVNAFRAEGHPRVVSGDMHPDEAREVFISAFDADGDQVVTYAEFLGYYAGLSQQIDNDEFFNHMVYNTWDLDALPRPPTTSPPPPPPKAKITNTHLTTRSPPPPPSRRIVGYTGHVPGAQDSFGESFSVIEKKSQLPTRCAKLPTAPFKDEEHAFVRKGNAANMHSFRLE